jgi:DUF3014 family protein
MGRYDDTPKSQLLSITLVIVLLLAIAGGVWFFLIDGSEKSQDVAGELTLPAIESPVLDNAGDNVAEQNSERLTDEEQKNNGDEQDAVGDNLEPVVVPALEESDLWVQQQISQLSPVLGGVVKTKQTASKLMQVVNDFSQSLRLYKHMRFFRLKQPFVAAKDGQGWFLNERSYNRYNGLVNAFATMDTAEAMRSYQTMQPLLQQIYAEFGYPEQYSLEDLFKKAAAEMIAAPVIDGRIGLTQPSVRYKFADPALERLSPVQKQMLRMGPDNTRKVQKKLRELVQQIARLQAE